MYIAMNRFSVASGREEEFETTWKNRDSSLSEMKGFREFKMLKGDESEGTRLYIAYTLWDDYQSFKAWTESEQFKAAHRNSKMPKGVIMSHPKFEGFEDLAFR